MLLLGHLLVWWIRFEALRGYMQGLCWPLYLQVNYFSNGNHNTHHKIFSMLSSPYVLQRRDCQAVNPNNNQEKLIWSHQRRPKQRDVGKVRQHCHPSNESHVKVPSTSVRPRRWENGNYEAPNEPGLPLPLYPSEFEEGTGITKDSMNQTMDNLQHNHLNFFL